MEMNKKKRTKFKYVCKSCYSRRVRTENSRCKVCRKKDDKIKISKDSVEKEINAKIGKIEKHLYELSEIKSKNQYNLNKVIEYWVNKKQSYKNKLDEITRQN